MGKLIAKIVLTGGPCAGKTTTITKVEEHLHELGYHVLILTECATETINQGIRPFGDNNVSVYDFENEILNLQLFKEERFDNFINTYPIDTKIVILYDRGCVDIHGYLNDLEYDKMLKQNNLNNRELLDRYDMVIHMTSLAKKQENRYGNQNNAARFENADEAINVDNNISKAWAGHNNIKVVPVTNLLEEKINIVIDHIDNLLKEKDK